VSETSASFPTTCSWSVHFYKLFIVSVLNKPSNIARHVMINQMILMESLACAHFMPVFRAEGDVMR
jgi:hypothetical protein